MNFSFFLIGSPLLLSLSLATPSSRSSSDEEFHIVNNNIVSSQYFTSIILDNANLDNNDTTTTTSTTTTTTTTSTTTTTTTTTTDSDTTSRVITNDVPWYDNNKNIMETNKGGKITKIKNQFYWIGTLPFGQLLIYTSSTLGSNSWTLARILDLKDQLPRSVKHNELGNCQLHQHPATKSNFIFCKRRLWFIQNTQNGYSDNRKDDKVNDDGDDAYNNDDTNTYDDNTNTKDANDPTIGTYTLLPVPKDPSSLKGFVFGGESTFQEDNDIYLIASRAKKGQSKTRTMFIYKLNQQWTNFESEIVRFKWRGRESPWMFKRKGMYYLFVSQTARWRDSKTFYKKSKSLIGFKDVDDHQVVMHPTNTRYIKSMGSQFRFVIQPESNDDDNNEAIERWIFGGDRYPVEAPTIWDSKYGRHVMCPLSFINDVPHVYWKKEFDWKMYKYDGDFDEHNHGTHGHGPSPLHDPILSLTRTT